MSKTVQDMARETGFTVWRGAGGAEHYGMIAKEGPARIRGKYLMITREDDTLARPTSTREPVLLSVFRRRVTDDDSAQEALSEHVYPNMNAAMNAVVSLLYS